MPVQGMNRFRGVSFGCLAFAALCLVVLGLAASSHAQAPKKAATAQPAARPAEAPKEPGSSLSGDSTASIVHSYALKQTLERGITLARMTNGLTVIVQENHAAPVATVRCYVQNTGSAYEGKDLGAGLSHVLEHTVAGGTTTKRSEAQIRGLLDSLGGQTNAYTSDDITCFLIDCPAAGVPTAIQLTAENMQFSLIPPTEYDRELGVVQRELEMGEVDRARVMYNQMKQLIYQVHPKRHPTIGYLNVVRQIKRDDVIAFYKHRYVPQNMVFVVVGDVSTDAVLDDVLENFRNFQRTPERFENMPAEPDQASPRKTRLEMEGATTQLAVAWPTVPLQDPDLYPLDVASFILTNGDSSRLVRRLKVEQPLAVSVTSFSNTPGGVKGWFQVSVDCAPENVEKCRAIIFEEIERLKTEPVTGKELAKAKRQKAADHVFSQQKVENQAEMLSESYRSTGDPLFDSRYVDGIQTVTPDQIQAVARRYFLDHRLNTVRIDPIGYGKGDIAQATESASESEIQKEVLPNGLTLLLKRAPAVPMVAIQVYARGGILADTAETSGAASLCTELLERGTEKYSAEEIAGYFDSIGGTLSLSSQSNTSYLQSTVLKDDAATALDYIHQVICKPTFPQAEFENVRELRLARIGARSANAQAEIMDFFASQLPPTSPYSRTALGRAETVGKLTRDEIKATWSRLFVPQNMVVSVFGDIDLATMKDLVTKSFGTLPKSSNPPDYQYPPRHGPFEKLRAEHLTNKKKNTGMVLISYPTVSIRDEKTRDCLDVLDAILTGGGAAGGRLHEELRGQQLVYYVFGIQMSGFAPGYFNFLAQTQPRAIPEVVGRIQAAIDVIRKEGVPAEEFEKAKAKLITAKAMRNTTPSERAFQSSLDELYGLGFDYERSYARRINAVTAEEVQDVVKKLFINPLVITTSPEAAPKLEPAAK